jgi:hypothetical protein
MSVLRPSKPNNHICPTFAGERTVPWNQHSCLCRGKVGQATLPVPLLLQQRYGLRQRIYYKSQSHTAEYSGTT